MDKQKWSEFIRSHRIKQSLTSRRLAELIGVDPSYITLMERNGCVPKREKVIALGRALRLNTDILLIVAGYAPEHVDLPLAIESCGAEDSGHKIIPELSALLEDMGRLPKNKQKTLVRFLIPLLNTLSSRSCARYAPGPRRKK